MVVGGAKRRETAALPLPPAGAFPHGPTNLRPALETVTRQAQGVDAASNCYC